MAFGTNTLAREAGGPEVVELQMRLAGFSGGAPDGDFGPGTEKQVKQFQRDWMQEAEPSGVADAAVFDALAAFGEKEAFDLSGFRCSCGTCNGFGQGRFKQMFRPGKPHQERFHMYEYPGIHRMLLWAYKAARFYTRQRMGKELKINSAYRCHEDNKKHGRASTNHMGKALDLDVPASAAENAALADKIRALLQETANAQIGWAGTNRKSLEPADIAPTWCHYDVRSYESKYLADKYFVTSHAALFEMPH